MAYKSGKLRFFVVSTCATKKVQIRDQLTKLYPSEKLGKFLTESQKLFCSHSKNYSALFRISGSTFFFAGFRKLSFEGAFLGFDLHH